MVVLFIVNEAAGNGKGKKVWRRLQQHLTMNYEVAFTKYEGHGLEIARQWAHGTQTKKLIVIVGGDGTIHEVVSGVVHNDLIVVGVVRAAQGMISHDIFRYFEMLNKLRVIYGMN